MWITLEDNCRKAPIVRENGGWPQPPELWITEKAGGECEQKKEQKIRKTGGKDWQPLWVHRLRPAACRAAALADAPDVCRRTLEEKGKRNGAKRVRERGVKRVREREAEKSFPPLRSRRLLRCARQREQAAGLGNLLRHWIG